MNDKTTVLGVHAVSSGFGWALLEGANTIHDWGTIGVAKQDNTEALRKISSLIDRWSPDLIAIEVVARTGKSRSPRVRALNSAILKLAKTKKIPAMSVSRPEIAVALGGAKTRAKAAREVANRLPSLVATLPKPRKAWMSEPRVMSVFSAVASALSVFSECA